MPPPGFPLRLCRHILALTPPKRAHEFDDRTLIGAATPIHPGWGMRATWLHVGWRRIVGDKRDDYLPPVRRKIVDIAKRICGWRIPSMPDLLFGHFCLLQVFGPGRARLRRELMLGALWGLFYPAHKSFRSHIRT